MWFTLDRTSRNIAYVDEVIYIEAALLLAVISNFNKYTQAGRESLNYMLPFIWLSFITLQ